MVFEEPRQRASANAGVARARTRAAPTHFVGRALEICRVWRALESRRHVIVTGPYGIGRTALARQVAALHGGERPFAFADLSFGGAAAVHDLYGVLATGRASRIAGLSHRAVRYRLLHDPGVARKSAVLVLDEITKLTHATVRLVSDVVRAGCFGIVAVVGAALPAPDLDKLRGCLTAPEVVRLGWLAPPEVREYLRSVSVACGFEWTREELEARVRGYGGYPLHLVEAVENERRRPVDRQLAAGSQRSQP